MNIIVKTIDGREFKIKVSNDDTFAQLKNKIQSLYDFTPDEQILLFQGTELSNDKSKLISCGIKNESVIYLSFKLRNFTVVVARQDGKSIKIPVSSEKTVQYLKEKIHTSWNTPIEQQTLMFRDEILENNKKLSDYRIDKECLISLIPKVANFHNIPIITCKIINGKTYEIHIDLSKTTKCLKEKISEVAGFLPDMQQLIFQGMLLEDNKTLVSSKIQDKSVIIIATKLSNSRLLICETLRGNVSLHVSDKETISQVKERILKLVGTEIRYLYFDGKVLSDNKFVGDYGLRDRSVIRIC